MKPLLKKLLIGLTSMYALSCQAQIYSFENSEIPLNWNLEKGILSISSSKYKLGHQALQIQWKAGDKLTISQPLGIEKASQSSNGGINAWFYNTLLTTDSIRLAFLDVNHQELCHLNFQLNFKGWRCLWAKFKEDMNMPIKSQIQTLEITFPKTQQTGILYLDALEFTPKVSWQKMSDTQYFVNQKDFSLIPNFLSYRKTLPQVNRLITGKKSEIELISKRLENWYLGFSDKVSTDPWRQMRLNSEHRFIKEGVSEAKKIKIKYDKDGIAVGNALYPMAFPKVIDQNKVMYFRTINEKMLLPLALDYRKNNNKESLNKARYIYDWFYDQGWADGSGLGTLCFEKLRSSGYFHSFFLLKDKLSKTQLERELNTLNWYTMFGVCYQNPTHTGEVADNLRALALPKLIYALSLTNEKERQIALTAYKNYMDNALGIAPGFYGTIKPDYSGYHHRGPYHSAYYPHALYAASLVAYLLHGTPYALSEQTMHHLKQGLLTFRFFSAELNVPAGTVGRFPKNQEIVQTILPAFAYVALSSETPDKELTAAFKRLLTYNQETLSNYIKTVDSNLTYTASIGEIELMNELSATAIAEEVEVKGNLFMPYSGVMISKDENFQFNMKGFSRYIWDFESSDTENLKGRYLAYGQIEYFDFKQKNKSFRPDLETFNWNYIPGATTKVLPEKVLQDKGGSDSGHRNFSDETFLAGVHASEEIGLFAFKLHDITYDSSFRANKSVFILPEGLLCLGSDIQNSDQEHPTVTTLFQSFGNQSDQLSSYIFEDQSCLYAVKDGMVKVDKEKDHCTVYLSHGTQPKAEKYAYFILKEKNKTLGEKLLNENGPVTIVRQDCHAHIVRHENRKIIYAALYDAQMIYNNLVLQKVNIPLAYVLEERNKGTYALSICEPNMRRASQKHMGLLTETDVIDQERSFETKLTLQGDFTVTCKQQAIKFSYDKQRNETTVQISTIRGENYSLLLHKNNKHEK